MKIIGISNHNLENVSDIIIAENIHNAYGKIIIDFLEDKTTNNSKYYPVLVEDGYQLYEFDPNR